MLDLMLSSNIRYTYGKACAKNKISKISAKMAVFMEKSAQSFCQKHNRFTAKPRGNQPIVATVFNVVSLA